MGEDPSAGDGRPDLAEAPVQPGRLHVLQLPLLVSCLYPLENISFIITYFNWTRSGSDNQTFFTVKKSRCTTVERYCQKVGGDQR